MPFTESGPVGSRQSLCIRRTPNKNIGLTSTRASVSSLESIRLMNVCFGSLTGSSFFSGCCMAAGIVSTASFRINEGIKRGLMGVNFKTNWGLDSDGKSPFGERGWSRSRIFSEIGETKLDYIGAPKLGPVESRFQPSALLNFKVMARSRHWCYDYGGIANSSKPNAQVSSIRFHLHAPVRTKHVSTMGGAGLPWLENWDFLGVEK